jgi:hypothetical protein
LPPDIRGVGGRGYGDLDPLYPCRGQAPEQHNRCAATALAGRSGRVPLAVGGSGSRYSTCLRYDEGHDNRGWGGGWGGPVAAGMGRPHSA